MVAIQLIVRRRGEPGWRDHFRAITGHWPGCPHVHPGHDMPPCECEDRP